MSRRPTPPTCAQCGADIPPNARACPHCGADERTGWDEVSLYDGLDLPDDDVDGASERLKAGDGGGVSAFWKLVGVVVVLAVITAFVLGRR